MRHLKSFEQGQPAARLRDILHARGVEAELREERDGGYAVWVLDEDHLEQARSLLGRFEDAPDDPELTALAAEGQAKRKKAQAPARRSRHREIDMGRRFRSPGRRYGRVTVALIGITVVVFLITSGGDRMSLVRPLMIGTLQEVLARQPLARVLDGEVWRLVTPIFLHFGLIHLVFNMLWLFDLGTMLEHHRSSRFLLTFVLLTGVLSNVAQYLIGGSPLFGGMSGVVYALLGYAWLRGRFDPRSGIALHRTIVILMVGWLLLGFSGLMMKMANIAHLSGLALGCAWGYLGSGDLQKRLRGR